MRIETKTLKTWEQYATKQGFYIGISTDYFIPIKSIRKAILSGECSEHIYSAINTHIEALKK